MPLPAPKSPRKPMHNRSIQVHSFEQLWERSEVARIPIKMPFGKHKGELIKDIPADYRRWLVSQTDLDPYLVKALMQ